MSPTQQHEVERTSGASGGQGRLCAIVHGVPKSRTWINNSNRASLPEPAVHSLITFVLSLQWYSIAAGHRGPKMNKTKFSPLKVSQARDTKQENRVNVHWAKGYSELLGPIHRKLKKQKEPYLIQSNLPGGWYTQATTYRLSKGPSERGKRDRACLVELMI